jgi:hypothetical protein
MSGPDEALALHVELLAVRLRSATSVGGCLRGVRRSRELARKHGLNWKLVWHCARAKVERAARRGVAV